MIPPTRTTTAEPATLRARPWTREDDDVRSEPLIGADASTVTTVPVKNQARPFMGKNFVFPNTHKTTTIAPTTTSIVKGAVHVAVRQARESKLWNRVIDGIRINVAFCDQAGVAVPGRGEGTDGGLDTDPKSVDGSGTLTSYRGFHPPRSNGSNARPPIPTSW
jgi:hypothetical protein